MALVVEYSLQADKNSTETGKNIRINGSELAPTRNSAALP
jgi:hypothetical protein